MKSNHFIQYTLYIYIYVSIFIYAHIHSASCVCFSVQENVQMFFKCLIHTIIIHVKVWLTYTRAHANMIMSRFIQDMTFEVCKIYRYKPLGDMTINDNYICMWKWWIVNTYTWSYMIICFYVYPIHHVGASLVCFPRIHWNCMVVRHVTISVTPNERLGV